MKSQTYRMMEEPDDASVFDTSADALAAINSVSDLAYEGGHALTIMRTPNDSGWIVAVESCEWEFEEFFGWASFSERSTAQ